jgi:hypothetical protein
VVSVVVGLAITGGDVVVVVGVATAGCDVVVVVVVDVVGVTRTGWRAASVVVGVTIAGAAPADQPATLAVATRAVPSRRGRIHRR